MMNPLRMAKDLNAFRKMYKYFCNARKEVEMGKNPLLSKTLWFNLIGLVLEFADVLPGRYAAPVLVVGNIFLRALTNQPLMIPWPKEPKE